jgi:hypothetical protein
MPNLTEIIELFIAENGGRDKLASIFENETPEIISSKYRWEMGMEPINEQCRKPGCYFCQKMNEHKEPEPEYIMSRMITLKPRYTQRKFAAKYWTQDEVDFLIYNYRDYKIKELSRKMQRSVKALILKKYKLRQDGVISF